MKSLRRKEMALDSWSSVVIAQTQCRNASVTLERLAAPPLPAAGVLVWSVVGHENTVHGGNQSCDDGEPLASVHSRHESRLEVS